MGASVAGLLTAAALSDYVDTVTVLDKDAFVSEKLSHDELKQVICTMLAPRLRCRRCCDLESDCSIPWGLCSQGMS